MQLLLRPSRTFHQDLLGEKKVTTLCFFPTYNTSRPCPHWREKGNTQKHAQLAVFSAVYETKLSRKTYLSKCTFIVKLQFQEKDFLAKREMKWKLKQVSCQPCCSQMSAVLTRHVSVPCASDGWKDVKSVCYRVAASRGRLWAGVSQHGSYRLRGPWFTPLHRWSSLLCATLVQQGQRSQAPQWHFCAVTIQHCHLIFHGKWQVFFPPGGSLDLKVKSACCPCWAWRAGSIFWGKPGPMGRAEGKWDKTTAGSLCFPVFRCGSGGVTKSDYTKSRLWDVCLYPPFCHTLLHAESSCS